MSSGRLDLLLSAVAPPACLACGRRVAPGPLCGGCARALDAMRPIRGAGPPGVDRAWSAAPHDGVARALVAALKFRRLLPVAALMAARIEALAPGWLLSGEVVPVPASPLRSRVRGFDPAAELASALAERAGLPTSSDTLRRRGPGRQAGRRRAERLAGPRVDSIAPAPHNVLLVDDVLTSGATIAACARALRGAGASRVVAVTFGRRP